jgi:Transglutaminase-like superfamily
VKATFASPRLAGSSRYRFQEKLDGMARGLLVPVKAAFAARSFLESARCEGGLYRLEQWPEVRGGRRQAERGVDAAVARLRVAERLMLGFLDPVEDALFVTAGLRRLGFPASFHLGRELVPSAAPTGFYAWVQCGDEVVSTSLPVQEEYVEVHRSTEG